MAEPKILPDLEVGVNEKIAREGLTVFWGGSGHREISLSRRVRRYAWVWESNFLVH
jgi:hypothetical protein